MPATGEGISASTLSVEISKIGLVALDGVADLLEPLGDGAFGDGLAHLRHQDFGSWTSGLRAAADWFAAGVSTAAGVAVSAAGAAAVSGSADFAGAAFADAEANRFVGDGADHGVDLDCGAFGDLDLVEGTGGWRRNLRVDLVGRDLEEGLVALHGVAWLLEPLGEGCLR